MQRLLNKKKKKRFFIYIYFLTIRTYINLTALTFGQCPAVFNSLIEHRDFAKFFLDATSVIHLPLMQIVAFPNIFANILFCKISTISKATLEGKSMIDSIDATLSENRDTI